MSRLRRFFRRLAALVRVRKAESELAREISAHLQLLEDQFIAKGLAPEEARYAAKRAFGGVEQAKEQQRDARSFPWLAGWLMDLKLGVRMLGKSPGLTIVAVIALAVAIGAGATYFEFVNDFFRPRLSFPGGDRLVGLLNYDLARADVEPRSLHAFAVWKAQLTAVQELGAARQVEHNLITEDGRAEPVRGVEISASAFRVVPTAPLHGRPLLDSDEEQAAAPVAVIGEDLWKARFNADPLVVGRTLRFGETTHVIVGVMPGGFGFPMNSSLWTPLRLDAPRFRPGEGPPVRIFGRLRPGADLDEAQAEMAAIAARADVWPGKYGTADTRPIVKPYVESLWASVSMRWQVIILYSFNILFLALLAICAANVATLVFARTATREAEITVRTALGASRGRIVAQLVAEAMVLALVAAGVGLAGATIGLRKVREVWVMAQNTPMPFWWNEQLGIDTIAYSLLLVALAALLIGGVPALKATGAKVQARLKEAGAGATTMRFGKLWTGVIVAQVAVTVVFLIAAVSLGWYTYDLNKELTEVAFQRDEYLTGLVGLREVPPEREKAVLRELRRRLMEDPAVINATYAVHLPGGGNPFWLEFPPAGSGQALPPAAAAKKAGDVLSVKSARIGMNYFETFKQPLVAGRLFTESDIEAGRNFAIVDESFMRLVLGGRHAVGQLVRQPPQREGTVYEQTDRPGPWLEIVGVVKDISLAPNKTAENAMLYRPAVPGDGSTLRIVVHTRSNEGAARLRAAAAATDPELRLSEVMTMDRLAETEAQTMGFFTSALGIVAAVALMLSTAGIYSLISFTLARRTREIGIRTALGAAPFRIITGILSRALVQIGIGVILGGIPGAVLLVWGPEVSSASRGWPAAIAATVSVALFIIGAAMISCIAPVRRALKIQPTEALRTT